MIYILFKIGILFKNENIDDRIIDDRRKIINTSNMFIK